MWWHRLATRLTVNTRQRFVRESDMIQAAVPARSYREFLAGKSQAGGRE